MVRLHFVPTVEIQLTDPDREYLRKQASDYVAKVGEVHRGRMTWQLAFLVAAVTVTGFAFETSHPEAFLLAGGILLFAYLSDIFFKGAVVMPLLYKALTTELQLKESEPVTLLMLDWNGGEQSKYATLMNIASAVERRQRFKEWYVRRGLVWKTVLFLVLIVAEVALYWCYSS